MAKIKQLKTVYAKIVLPVGSMLSWVTRAVGMQRHDRPHNDPSRHHLYQSTPSLCVALPCLLRNPQKQPLTQWHAQPQQVTLPT